LFLMWSLEKRAGSADADADADAAARPFYSFFGTQQGDFSLTLSSIEAVALEQEEGHGTVNGEGRDTDSGSDSDSGASIKKGSGSGGMPSQPVQSWWKRIWGRCLNV
jgi:hypothetical protein